MIKPPKSCWSIQLVSESTHDFDKVVIVTNSHRMASSQLYGPNNGKNPFDIPGAVTSGTGRRLPPTPRGQTLGALPLNPTVATAGGGAGGYLKKAVPPLQTAGPGSGQRPKRELPKPQSLELRHSNHEYMNIRFGHLLIFFKEIFDLSLKH